MGLFEAIRKNDNKWTWFILTVVASLLPVLFRFLAWTDFNIKIFDIKDLLFAGLAINLSNLNLVGSKEFDEKINIVLFSVLFIILFSFVLGIMLICEAFKAHTTILNWLSIAGTDFSIYQSFEANNYVFKSV